MRTFAKLPLLAILTMTLCVSMLAQGPMPPPGRNIDWMINLNSVVADGPSGTAHYTAFIPAAAGKIQTRFSVECEYLAFPTAGAVLDVFLRTPVNPTPIENRYIGHMVVKNGSAAMLLLTANAPVITKGTKIIVTVHDGPALMVGTF